MQRGIELEAEAKGLYSLITSSKLQDKGFCLNNGVGCSPDAFVGKPGLLEVKCPIMSTHIGYLLENKLPIEYFQQVQGQLLVTGREWCDFLSYYPGLKPLIIRVQRDEKFLKILAKELKIFCKDLKVVVRKIK